MPPVTQHSLYPLEHIRDHLEAGDTVLTPNHRLARRIKAEWDRRQHGAGLASWSPVAVAPLEHFLTQRWRDARDRGLVPRRQLIDAGVQQELWLRVIEQAQLESGSYSLLQPAAAAQGAATARDNLIRWQLNPGSESLRSQFLLDPDCATFLDWLTRFDDVLASKELVTPSEAFAQLLDCHALEPVQTLVLVDFDDVAPLLRSAAGHQTERLVELQSPGEMVIGRVASYAGRQEELEAAADWAARLHADKQASRIGIVLMDMQVDRPAMEYALRREFGCLGERYAALPVNFSASITLDRAPVVRDALLILQSSTRQLRLVDAIGLLQSRFSRATDSGSARAVKFLRALADDGREQLNTGRLRYLASTVADSQGEGLTLGDCLLEAARARAGRKTLSPSEWVTTFCELLDAWGWPGPGPLDSLEYQQVTALYEAFDQFAAWDILDQALDINQALQSLRRCLQARISQPKTPDTAVQVLGPLEAAGLHFDHLWLCGLQGSRWPPAPRPSPFIPVAIQRNHAMPHASAEREWRYAMTLTNQFRRASGELIASYSTHVDGVPELPSPVLTDWSVAPAGVSDSLPADWVDRWQQRHREIVTDQQAPAVSDTERQTLSGGSGLLEDQALCGFRAFARRRLKLQPLGDYRTALSAAERGSLLHSALFNLWSGLEDSSSLSGLDTVAAADAAAQAAVTDLRESVRERVGQPCLQLERQRLARLLQQWLALEQQRPPFRVLQREQDTTVEVAGLVLRVRLDRIDACDEGELLIDYKSSAGSIGGWLGERLTSPQLPLYTLASDRVGAVAYAQVRLDECRFVGLGEIQGVAGIHSDLEKATRRYAQIDDWRLLLRRWEQGLVQLAQSFLDGEAAIDPTQGACTYCGLQAVCRVNLRSAESVLS